MDIESYKRAKVVIDEYQQLQDYINAEVLMDIKRRITLMLPYKTDNVNVAIDSLIDAYINEVSRRLEELKNQFDNIQ